MNSGLTHTAEFVEREYNLRAAFPDHPAWFARYAAESEAARTALTPKLDLRYGPGAKETLDLFVPPAPARATFVFLHGGYWRALDKGDFSFVAPPFVARDIAVAVVNYDLCPAVSIATIVDECRRAVRWLVTDGAAHGAHPGGIVVAGHSAGGHLAAMLFATDWEAQGLPRNPLVGGVSLSGVHDLVPLVLFSYNVDLGLDEAEAARLSPIRLEPRTTAPLLIAVGAAETSEFLRQARLLWDAWPGCRLPGARGPLFVPARDHFGVVADYGNPESELTRQTLGLF